MQWLIRLANIPILALHTNSETVCKLSVWNVFKYNYFAFLIHFCVQMSSLLTVTNQIAANIISGTLVTLGMDGEVKCIALWDTVHDWIASTNMADTFIKTTSRACQVYKLSECAHDHEPCSNCWLCYFDNSYIFRFFKFWLIQIKLKK